MQFGDVIFGSRFSDLLIGGLGTDVLAGGGGSDVILGGVEHFNPANRDRAFGGSGNDPLSGNPVMALTIGMVAVNMMSLFWV